MLYCNETVNSARRLGKKGNMYFACHAHSRHQPVQYDYRITEMFMINCTVMITVSIKFGIHNITEHTLADICQCLLGLQALD